MYIFIIVHLLKYTIIIIICNLQNYPKYTFKYVFFFNLYANIWI